MRAINAWLVAAAEGEVPLEAHHWLFPETKEIVLGGLAFFIIAGLLWVKAMPAARKGFAARTERIANQLDESAAARASAEAEVAGVRAELAGADDEAARIVAEAHEAAAAYKADAALRIEQDLVDARTRALAEIASSGDRSANELQAQIGRLSLGAAERVITAGLDDATQQDLIERFIQQVGASGRAS
jgi:F-type H+-transporting ATPase subunit b